MPILKLVIILLSQQAKKQEPDYYHRTVHINTVTFVGNFVI